MSDPVTLLTSITSTFNVYYLDVSGVMTQVGLGLGYVVRVVCEIP